MENITLGQIAVSLAFIVGLIGSIKYLKKELDESIQKQFKPLNDKLDNLDLNQCKNFLVRFLADVEHGEKIDEVEIKRAYDVYDHYKDDLHGNSYIGDKWNKLMK